MTKINQRIHDQTQSLVLDVGELIERHIEALYTHDDAGDIVRVREHNGGAAPRFFLGRTADAIVRRFRADVAEPIRRELIEVSDLIPRARVDSADDVSDEMARYAAILARSTPISSTFAGPAFAFPDISPRRLHDESTIARITEANVALLADLLSSWTADVHHSPPLMAVIVDDRAVAVCASVRITDCAHEAGVETAPSYRGHGYAVQVVAAWANQVHSLGAEPLYSTSWNNSASRAVAAKLGLIQFGCDLHIT